ncbi:probable N-acetyltransferase 16 isoform X2 [Protopterus annectens]|nr:probable N-acetyltransferase 16 isoform X2 [Protopterus annectens]
MKFDNKTLDTEMDFIVATDKEFGEVIAMSKGIYGGLDYLPSRYHSWLKDANRMVILARKDGKVIALESVCIIDDGETMLVEGLRVAPSERGKGVAGILQKYCIQLVKEKYPNVKIIRLTRDDKLGPKDFRKYRLITKQGILLVRFNVKELRSRMDDIVHMLEEAGSELCPTVILEREEVKNIILSMTVSNKLLPSKTIIQDWQPFKPIESNLNLLLKKDLHWIVDNKQCPNFASLCTFPFRIPIGDDWFYLNIDMFGKDLAHIKSHLIAHLHNHTQNGHGNIMCQIFMEPSLWEDMAYFCKHVICVEIAKGYTEQYLLESDLHP